MHCPIHRRGASKADRRTEEGPNTKPERPKNQWVGFYLGDLPLDCVAPISGTTDRGAEITEAGSRECEEMVLCIRLPCTLKSMPCRRAQRAVLGGWQYPIWDVLRLHSTSVGQISEGGVGSTKIHKLETFDLLRHRIPDLSLFFLIAMGQSFLLQSCAHTLTVTIHAFSKQFAFI